MMAVVEAGRSTYLDVFRHRLRQYAQATMIVSPMLEYMVSCAVMLWHVCHHGSS